MWILWVGNFVIHSAVYINTNLFSFTFVETWACFHKSSSNTVSPGQKVLLEQSKELHWGNDQSTGYIFTRVFRN